MVFQLADAPLSIGQILDSGFRLFRASFTRVVPLSVATGILSAVLAPLNPAVQVDADPAETATIGVVFLVASVVVTVFSIAFGVAIIARIHAVAVSEDLSLGDSIKVGFRRLIPFFATSVLYGFAVLLGGILLLVPGIILSVSLSVAFYPVVVKPMGPIASLRYSHSLVWGNWWRTLALVSMIMVMAVVIYALIALIGGLIGGIFGIPDTNTIILLFNGLVSPMITAVITPLVYALGYAIYHDLTLRREGGDIAARIDAAQPTSDA